MADGRDFDVMIVGAGAGIGVFFAGEACSKDQFGTAHAAFTTAVSAAERIITALALAS